MGSKTVTLALAVAIATTSLDFAAADAFAQKRGQEELVNRVTPFVCMTDDGYERWTSCDLGGN